MTFFEEISCFRSIDFGCEYSEGNHSGRLTFFAIGFFLMDYRLFES